MKTISPRPTPVNPSIHQYYNVNENYSHWQLGVFAVPKPDLTVACGSKHVTLADDHYCIHSGSWFAGVQLIQDKAHRVIERIGNRPNPGSITVAIKGGAA